MIPRRAEKTLKEMARGYPIIAVTGPRQSGKTTLVRHVFNDREYVSLEEPDMLELATGDPRGFLSRYGGGVIIDEAQRAPALFSYLQAKVDIEKRYGAFILTGSQQFGLLSGITQSLAGRAGMVQLLPFSLEELKNTPVKTGSLFQILYKGMYPPLYDRKLDPKKWYASYIMTYIERDVRKLVNVKDLAIFQRFLRMCAARIGQLLNLSSLAADCGITHNTARAWISVLEASYIVFLLQPHFKNFGKRLVKTPKLYFFDTGLAAQLLNIQDPEHLAIHPQRGGLFESFVIGEQYKMQYNEGVAPNFYFWRNNLGDEIDLIIDKGDRLLAVEIKSGNTLNNDFFLNLEKWRKTTRAPADHTYLVFGGDSSHTYKGTKVFPWKDCVISPE
ncbi:MAG: AAA family ATPase [Spirochaetes bacterium RBG_16_49_21]|nr:MAG: AAA family ATPase [Spirochaetes bacterium RBG_16_49_21]